MYIYIYICIYIYIYVCICLFLSLSIYILKYVEGLATCHPRPWRSSEWSTDSVASCGVQVNIVTPYGIGAVRLTSEGKAPIPLGNSRAPQACNSTKFAIHQQVVSHAHRW